MIEVSSPRESSQNHAPSENGEGAFKGLGRIKLGELLPEDGAASGVYTRAVEELSLSLARNNAAIIELNGEDAALVRCALDSAKLYFRSRKPNTSWNPSDWHNLSGYCAAPTKEMYYYRAGRYCHLFDARAFFSSSSIPSMCTFSSMFARFSSNGMRVTFEILTIWKVSN